MIPLYFAQGCHYKICAQFSKILPKVSFKPKNSIEILYKINPKNQNGKKDQNIKKKNRNEEKNRKERNIIVMKIKKEIES